MKRKPHYTSELGRARMGQTKMLLVALRLLAAFPRRDPHHTELTEKFGMSRATAYRWIAALNDARGKKYAPPLPPGSTTQ